MRISILAYNPYNNRNKMGFQTWAEYSSYILGNFDGINFNPNDGVNTELILNTGFDSCDYLIVSEENTAHTINSRWFILDCERTRGGQFRFKLYRDVVYDNLNAVMNSRAFIEKGWISSLSSPYLFNQEGITTNQIKQSETLLKDPTERPWIVGYLTKDAPGGEAVWGGTLATGYMPDEDFDALQNDVLYDETAPLNWLTTIFSSTRYQNNVLGIQVNSPLVSPTPSYILYADPQYRSLSNFNFVGNSKSEYDTNAHATADILASLMYTYRSTWGSILQTLIPLKDRYNRLKTLYESTAANPKYFAYGGKVYEITFEEASSASEKQITQSGFVSNDSWLTRIANRFNSEASSYITRSNLTKDDIVQNMQGTFKGYRAKLKEVIINNYNITIPQFGGRVTSNSQPYTLFCMPATDYYYKSGGTVYQSSGEAARSIAMAMSQKYRSTGSLIDLQLLPYCPVPQLISGQAGQSSLNVDLVDGVATQKIPIYNKTSQLQGYMILFTNDSIDIDIYPSWVTPSNVMDAKKIVQAQTFRLVSPNGSSAYEFNPFKAFKGIGSALPCYRVYMTCKPYNPFIAVIPQYTGAGLYHAYNKDMRGLICQGDFSMPQTTSGWEAYQINNKNYLNAFNRQIESVELNNKYAKQRETNAVWKSGISGITSSLMAGAFSGGIGAVTGGLSTAVNIGTGLDEIKMSDALRADQLDLQKDMFNYNLENIQAQPTTISKVGAIDIINHLWPYLEIYDCSAEEKVAIENKILYSGMSIGVVSILSYFAAVGHFIQGDLIQINLHEDWHMINTIKEELKSGFYYGGIS